MGTVSNLIIFLFLNTIFLLLFIYLLLCFFISDSNMTTSHVISRRKKITITTVKYFSLFTRKIPKRKKKKRGKTMLVRILLAAIDKFSKRQANYTFWREIMSWVCREHFERPQGVQGTATGWVASYRGIFIRKQRLLLSIRLYIKKLCCLKSFL